MVLNIFIGFDIFEYCVRIISMTFNSDIQRLGFCCKYMEADQSQPKKVLETLQRPLNTRGTTVAWLNRQTTDVAHQRLWDITQHNIESFQRLIEYVGTLPENLRMVRLGSDCLPVFTEPTWRSFYDQAGVRDYCQRAFARVGETARASDVRISFHPGQFCVMASDRPEVVERSIDEFEYHATMARWMGYGQKFMDMKINVHISGKLGAEGIKKILPRLSTEARNTMTIENDEMKWGLDESLKLRNHVALVLDIHHHFIREGEYIMPDDDRFKRVIDSWRGERPTIHYSYSRCEHLPDGFKHDSFPDMAELLAAGHKKAKLRAHSDYYPNNTVNEWALSFLPYTDIMCESKCKNLASKRLYEFWKAKEDSVTAILESETNPETYA